MRNFKSKAVCLLSSAVLLCGASGMTANAAANYSFTATSRPTITAMTVSEYYLDTGNGMRVYGSGTGYCVITDAAGNKITSNTANGYKGHIPYFKLLSHITVVKKQAFGRL
ncbi:hypothetical protein [Ruminococcus flavefaciens]|uniref:hypothetical protein n=1 Tax=Ruminococcus flavefaciens TaxID=1265 RepID=UPI0013DB0DFC|nr:hypothetical protein [Ruminococcus flavefaciens]